MTFIVMRKVILIPLLFVCVMISAQTKQETFDYIKDKLKDISLKNSSIEHAYSILEMGGGSREIKILIVNACNKYPPVASGFAPNSFKSISISEKPSSLWFNINCIENSIHIYGHNSDGELIVEDTESSVSFILDKGTPKEDIDRLKKAFLHLFKLYGVERKELFD